MSEKRTAGEQSMEDILASIRRIISDDGEETVGGGRVDAAASVDEVIPLSAPGDLQSKGSDQSSPSESVADDRDDFSDIVEAGRAAGSKLEPVSSFGEPPKAATNSAPESGSRSLGAASEESMAARMERPASLTERLAIRERLAALDLKKRASNVSSKSDVEPVARRDSASRGSSGTAFPAIELAGPEPAVSNEEAKAGPASEARDASPQPAKSAAMVEKPAVTAPIAPVVVPAMISGKKEEEALNGALPDRDEKPGATKSEPAKPAPARENSAAAARAKARSAPVPGLGPQSPGSTPTESVLKPKPSSSKVAGPAVVATRAEQGAAARAPGSDAGAAIPSSEAVGVADLNKASDGADKTNEEPPRELIGAARDALYEDATRDEEGASDGGASATALEDVVRDALKPVLKTWLDENLPKIIEKQVREEVRRAMADGKRNFAG
jgi:cell pole-organizing protein PopZ